MTTQSNRKNIESVYQLSPMQQGMVFHSLYEPASGLYTEQISCKLRGSLNIDQFRAAWQAVIQRHAVLRTSFHWSNSAQPLQIVQRQVALPWIEQDWRTRLPEEQEADLVNFLQEERTQGFELRKAPLMRFHLFRLADDLYQFTWSNYHALFDGWSRAQILEEVFAFYMGQERSPRAPEHTYREYIAWLQKQDLAEAERYWRAYLRGIDVSTPLGLEEGREIASERIATVSLELPRETMAALRLYAQQQRLTVNTIVQGAWALLLSRYSGEQDILYGTTVSGRSPVLPDIETMVGLFINTLPVRARIEPQQEVGAWLRALQEQLVEQRQYEYTPLAQIQGWSQVQHGQPLFESLVVFENYPVNASVQAGLRGIAIEDPVTAQQTNYALTLAVAAGSTLLMQLSYAGGRFDTLACKRLLEHMRTLLESIAASAGRPLGTLWMLPEEEWEMVRGWQGATCSLPEQATVHEVLYERARQWPDAIAVVAGEHHLSYGELHRRAEMLSVQLRACGVRPEDRVALCLARSLDLPIAMLAVLKAGGAYVPLDPAYPSDRLAFLLQDAQVRLSLTQHRVLERLPQTTAPVYCMETLWEGCEAAAEPQNKPVDIAAGNLAYVIYTSGSTGVPKGTLVEHRGLCNMMVQLHDVFVVQPGEHVLQFCSISFDASVFEILMGWYAGASMWLLGEDGPILGRELGKFMLRAGITRTAMPASSLGALEAEELPDLRTAIAGGEACSVELVSRWGRGREMYNVYGLTETSVWATAQKCDVEEEVGPGIGRPIGNVDVYLLDSDMQPVPIGIAGEIYVGGICVSRGYLGRPEMTAERFVPHPWGKQAGERLYRTGDQGRYRENGIIEYVGRKDGQVKVRGYRIELGEIEALLGDLEGVRTCAVRVKGGEIVAYVVAEAAAENGQRIETWRQELRQRMPGHQIPSAFVFLERLPLTPNGKVDARALLEHDVQHAERTGQYVAPYTPTQELLAGVWRQVLNVEHIGVEDDFFILGGHSLLATQIYVRLRAIFSVDLPLRDLFEAPTIAALAARVDALQRARTLPEVAEPMLERRPDIADLPLSFAQQRLWFLDQWEPHSSLYNVATHVRLQGQLDVLQLDQSLQQVIQRHEVLRTTFVSRQGVPMQRIAPTLRGELLVVDLSDLPAEEQEAMVRQLVTQDALAPFDLATGPLLRMRLLRLQTDEHELLVSMHHIVTDGWSMGVLVRELSAFYTAGVAGEALELPDLPLQYADYALWQRKLLQGEVLERQLSYWRSQLAGVADMLTLPTDFVRPTELRFQGTSQVFLFPYALLEKLRAMGQREGVTLFMLLLASFQILLARYSGQEDVVVGTPTANRSRPELEELIGFFVNTLVLRTDVSGDPTVREVLRRVREVCLGAYAHQEFPFEQLVELLQPERDLSHAPLVQVLLTLQNTPLPSTILPGLRSDASGAPLERATAKFDLSVSLNESSSGLEGRVEYNTSLFAAPTIGRFLEHWQRLLEELAVNVERHLQELSMLSQQEHAAILASGEGKKATYSRERCVHQLFEEQAQSRPEALALVFEEKQISYGELNRRANQLARVLRRRGVGPEECVGLCLERGPEMIIGLLAILKAGGAYVPLDPAAPAERLVSLAQDAQVIALLTDRPGRELLAGAHAPLLCFEEIALAEESSAPLDVEVSTQNPAYVLYTSGSTGQPKGVVVTHRAVVNYIYAMSEQIDFQAGTSSVLVQPLIVDSTVTLLFGALCQGGCLHLIGRERALDAVALNQALHERPGDYLKIAPSHLAALLQGESDELLPDLALIIGGEPSQREWVCSVQQRRPDLRIYNHYGPTETTVGITMYPVVSQVAQQQATLPLGRPLANTQIFVLQTGGQLAPVGVVGEIYVGGENLARGYLGRTDLTAERFVPHPFSQQPGARLYRTGDLGSWQADGTLIFMGRLDQQVKVRGYRIELGEIETVLQRHADVQAAVVQARTDGENAQKRLIAYVVARDTNTLQEQELREYARQYLPEYMLPVAYVLLDSLPLTPHGKLDQRALPAPIMESRSEERRVPQTEVQRQLAQIWQQVLGMEQVGITDNFFALGGDSILSIQIVARAGQAGLRLTPKLVFQAQTIVDLARLIERQQETAPVIRESARGQAPLTPSQHRFFAQNRQHPEHYNQSILLRWGGALDARLLEEVLIGLGEQHESLRLRFEHQVNGWQQWYGDEEDLALHQVDLSGLPAWERSAALEQAAAQVQGSLNLGNGPMWRAVLFGLGKQEAPRLLLVLHHLVVDGVSWRILLEELRQGYEQRERGEALVWPVRSSSYQQWGQALQTYASSAALKEQLPYWQQVSQSVVGRVPVLKQDAIAQRNMVASMCSVQVRLEREETRALLQEVPGVYHTHINEVLLTALGLSLAAWTGERRWRIALEGHGREPEVVGGDLDISRTVGWFTSLYPQIVDVEENEELGRVLKGVKEQVRRVPQAGLGYGVLRYLLGHHELAEGEPEISFNYLGQVDSTFEAAAQRWEVAQESMGPLQSEIERRPYLLSVSAIISEGQLQIEWGYSEELHAQEQIEQAAQQFVEQLRAIIAHCRQPGVGGFTPSDFPLAHLTQSQLVHIEQQGAIEDLYPLSPMQQGMLFHTLYEPEGGLYVGQISCDIQGPLDRAAFQRAWQAVIARHAILRTAFIWEGVEEPVQVVRASVVCPWDERDWRGLSGQEQQAAFDAFLRQERVCGFVLDQAPLMRLSLFYLSDQHYRFTWTNHHLIFDGWSRAQLLKEVFALYEAGQQGLPVAVEQPRSYRDYITWLQQQDQEAAERFWRQRVGERTHATPLGLETPRGQVEEGTMASEYLALTQAETRGLQRLVRERQVTMNTLVQAAWAILLSRYSRERDVVYGMTVAGRPASFAEAEAMVGLFINTLPVCLEVPEEVTIGDWLQQVQQQLLDVQQYDYTPLVQIQGWSGVPRGLPLFESLVVFENYPIDSAVQEGIHELQFELIHVAQQTNYPLMLVAGLGAELRLRLTYALERFDAVAIRHMLGHFQNVLQAMLSGVERQLHEVSVLSRRERMAILASGEGVRVAYPQERCVHQLFEEQAHSRPEALALVLEEKQISYGELNQRANQLARVLRRQGVGPEECVGLCVERGPEMIIGLLAILKAGAAYVPLDPAYPAERLAFMLRDARIAVLLAQQSLRAFLPETTARIFALDTDWEQISGEDGSDLYVPVSSLHMAYVIYTSGSTGQPKGVVVTHRSVINLLSGLDQAIYSCESRDQLRIGLNGPLAFDTSVKQIIQLLHGHILTIVPQDARLEVAALTSYADQHALDALDCTPLQLRHLLLDSLLSNPDSRPTHILLGGDEIDDALWHRLGKDRHHNFYNLYGPTECTVDTTVGRVSPETGRPSIGSPIPNVVVYTLDAWLQPVPVGVVGEIYVGGENLARGYLGQPDLTAERFVPHPFSQQPGARLYRTGDLGCWQADGTLTFMGRQDQQVKVRGYRIELGEIEAVLQRHAGVQEAVVQARTDEDSGQKRLVAYLVAHDANTLDTHALREDIRRHLPEYMLPTSYVLLDALPLTPNGKLDRRALPAPDADQRFLSSARVAPQTQVQQQLAQIWQQVLGVEQVGIMDNFFALGGDSILSIQIVARAGQAGLRLTPKQVFQAQTIVDLARLVEEQQETVPIVREPARGLASLTPIQHRFFAQNRMHPEHYNQSILLRWGGALDVGLLEEVLLGLQEQHESLRLRFEHQTETWQQWYAEAETVIVQEVDLSGLPVWERSAALEQAAAQVQGSLDLSNGPVWRIVLFTLGEQEAPRLLLVLHHLVVDGVSWRILLEELRLGYEQRERGEALVWQARSSSYQQWGQALQNYAGSAALRELAYWQQVSQETVGQVPGDAIAQRNTLSSMRSVSVHLEREETRALLQEVPGVYHTHINEVLLTALGLSLAAWTGERRWRIALEGHGREPEVVGGDLDISRTVGWFTSLYPQTIEVDADQKLGKVLKGVKEQVRRVPHAGLGYGVLRYLAGHEELEIDEEIRFNYLGQVDSTFEAAAQRWEVAQESMGPLQSGTEKRFSILEIGAIVSEGRLEVNWRYSEELQEREQIEQVAEQFVEQLRAIIAHCRQPGVGGFTPSDFPLAHLTQPQLENIEQQGVIEDLYPLSPMQQGMLFHTLYEPTSYLYNEEISCQIHGSLNVGAFQRAWQAVVARHAILRTGFVWEGVEEPVQVVHAEVVCPWDERDWRGLSEPEQQAAFDAFLRQERARGFVLDEAPLMRLALFHLTEQRFYFVWTHHHLLLDGWSLGQLLKEVFTFYIAEQHGTPVALEQPRSYGGYIAWLQQQDQEAAERFWRRTLGERTHATPLSLEPPSARGHVEEGAVASEYLTLTQAETNGLQWLAREQQVTMNTLVQAAWAILLSRYSREREVVYGMTVAGRPTDLPGIEQMIGLFINTLPVRLEVTGEATIGDWLQQVQQQVLDVQQYDYCSLSQIQEWSGVPRGMPLFESLVVFENYPVDSAVRDEVRELEVEQMQVEQHSNYPLALIASLSGQLRLRLSYSCERFEVVAMKRMLGHLRTLLQAIAVDSTARLSAIALLSPEELHQILSVWNAAPTPYPSRTCIHALFEAGVEQWADAVSVTFAEQQLTYGELNRRANQIAHYLQKQGVGPETNVGLCVEHSLDLITGMLGILKAGGAYVPLDPTYPPERLTFMLNDAHISVLLTQSHLRALFSQQETAHVMCLDRAELIDQQPMNNPTSTACADNTAYIVYTSGSTGAPKGIRIPHKAVNRLVIQTDYVTLKASDHMAQASNASFDALTFEIWGALLHGARVVVIMKEQALLSQHMAEQIYQQGITTLFLTTALFNQIVREAPEAFAPLKNLLFGGEAVDPRLVRDLLDSGRPERLLHVYGPTESTTFATWYEVEAVSEQARTVPIGGALARTQIYVLDQDLGLLPVGIPGELYIGGDGLAHGYLERPQLTAERFVPHPYASEEGARLYKTGDIVRWNEDGKLEFMGRVDNQVKIRGHRIEPDEVEVVVRQHPTVREVLVMIREDSPGDRRMVAYVVPHASGFGPLTAQELRSYAQEYLPAYMIPAVFMIMETLPLTPNGKIDRGALPMPGPDWMQQDETFVAPYTPMQELLAGIWQQVLGLERVSIHSNFFALGGHSLLATQVHSRLRNAFAFDLPLRLLFEVSTLADLAAQMEMYQRTDRGLPAEEPPLVPRTQTGLVPASFAQQRLWFLDQWEPESPLYNVASAVRLIGMLDVAALRKGLQRVVERHESLRTTFINQQGYPMQVIAAVLELSVPVIDLSTLSPDERDAQAIQLASDEARQPFSLAHGPLLRVRLLRLSEEEHALILCMHHIVADGWSMGVLVRDLSAFFSAEVSHQPIELPAMPIQYADYAIWQRQWLQGEVLERELSYWLEQLANAPELLNLPLDYARPPVQSHHGASQALTLSPELLEKLRKLSQSEGVTLFMTLLAIFQTLLAFASGQDDIIVGTPIANRTRPELEGIIGFFVNTLVLRTRLADDPTVTELLQRVREVCLGAYAHQDLPFERLVQQIQPRRTTSYMPLFQVWFVLMEDDPASSVVLPGLTLKPQAGQGNLARYDLRLNLYTGANGLHVSFEYQTDLFVKATIERMLRHFAHLLQEFADASEQQRLSTLLRSLQEADQQLRQERQETVSTLKQQKLKRVRREAVKGVLE